MTTTEIISRALRLFGAKASNMAIAGSEQSEGLETLNGMLHSWKLKGINLNHTNYTSGETVYLPDEVIDAVIYNLVPRLAPEYEIEPAAYILMEADMLLRRLEAKYKTTNTMRTEFTAMPRKTMFI